MRVVILLLRNAKFAIPKREKKFSTTMKKIQNRNPEERCEYTHTHAGSC